MLRLLTVFAALIAVFVVAPRAGAHPRHTTTRYDAVHKLGRGLAGMTTGFLELPGNIVAVNREQDAGAAATIGFAKGLGMIPVRELVGVYEFVTSPIPFPEDYRPVVYPDYPWDYFDDDTHSASFSAD
jgi:putative exosortase-associated protein (TIGR04073 family)